MPINCSNCKAYCCRNAGLLEPSLDRGDGVCKHLTKDYKCDIYDHRPLICDTDRMYELLYSSMMTREEYDKLNHRCCEQMRYEKESNKEEEDRPEDTV